jgi:hypothetical protein
MDLVVIAMKITDASIPNANVSARTRKLRLITASQVGPNPFSGSPIPPFLLDR